MSQCVPSGIHVGEDAEHELAHLFHTHSAQGHVDAVSSELPTGHFTTAQETLESFENLLNSRSAGEMAWVIAWNLQNYGEEDPGMFFDMLDDFTNDLNEAIEGDVYVDTWTYNKSESKAKFRARGGQISFELKVTINLQLKVSVVEREPDYSRYDY